MIHMSEHASESGNSFVRGPKWDLYRYFLAVAKSNSVSGAAQVMRESAPTVSRRIRELERHFSASLFTRGPAKLTLTPAGEQLLDRLAQIDRDMRTIDTDLVELSETPKGRVTITAPRGFGKAVLFQCLGELRQAYPQIEFQAIFGNKKLNLRNREADIAIRFGEFADDRMIAQKIGAAKFALYASENYLSCTGSPTSIGDLSRYDFIDLADGASLTQIAETRRLLPDLQPSLTVDCILLQAFSASQGLGFAPLPKYMASTFPELVEILPGTLTDEREVWLLTHPDTSNSACVQATLRAIVPSTIEALEAWV